MSNLEQDLLRPGTELIETHTSWVFLGVDTVWKIKKPVDFGFLDFTTVDERRRACEAEVKLNARLAPGVYQGVVPVCLDESGRHRLEGDGAAVDWAVKMARLPESRRADTLLQAGALRISDIDLLAECIARFHNLMPTDERIAEFGKPEVLLDNVRENFSQTRDTVREHLNETEAQEIEHKQLAFIEEHRNLLDARCISGRVRDGHGDLRLEHVYLTGDGPSIIDCIEFNERFRYEDVCADAAFLSMDLERLGRVDLAERFIASYARAASDFDLYPLLDFYEGYRAYVRGKVASMLAHDAGASAKVRARAAKDARRYYMLALSAGRESLLSPVVVAVGGVIASGKSTIAEQLSTLLTAPVLDTDTTRKSLLGVAPTQPMHEGAWQGAYAPERTDAVYAEVLRRADRVVASERPVVLDASFRSRAARAAARALAQKYGVPFFFVETQAPRALCRDRLRQRARSSSVSDGRLEIFDDFIAQWEPVTEISPSEHIVVDTTKSPGAVHEQLERRLPVWPAGLTQ